MSALPLMRPTALMAVALAFFATAGTLSSQTSSSTRTERKPRAAATAHPSHRPVQLRSGGRVEATERAYSNSHENLGTPRAKRTPAEVGRAAGLAILRQRGGAQALRSRKVHVERRRSMRRLRLERASWRSGRTGAARSVEPDDTADGYSAPEAGQADADDAPSMDSRQSSSERAAIPAESEDSADTGTEAVERMAPAESGAEKTAADRANRRDEVAAEASEKTGAAALRQSGEAAGSAGAKTESDIASLVVPRGGMPLPLRGSLASLERQNDRLEAEGLERIEDEADLAARIADKLLVPIPISSALSVNPDLEENHRYCRPWTARFLADLARAHDAAFHRSIEVSSAVRTVEYQKRLERINGNAAPAEGDLVSPHLTGATVDIAKKGLSRAEMSWMRTRLMGLEAEGKIDVEEEFKQACFHITVYKSYAPAGKTGPATPAKPVADHSRTAEQVEAQGE